MKNVNLLVPLLIFAPQILAENNVEQDDLFAEETMPVVLSATRLRQSQVETPAAVTIIGREEIKASGARNIVEALRLVPGVNIFYSNGSTPEVSIHGLLTEYSRRLQVLVDGQSVFKPGLSRVLWSHIPINIDEIERIEVIRGPNTSSYGSNAFLGVINIISRHPADGENYAASITTGNHGIIDGYFSYSNSTEDFSYRLSAGYQQDNGFTGERNGVERQDSHDRQYFRADMHFNSGIKNNYRLTLSHSQGTQEIDLLDVYQTEPVHPLKINDSNINFNWEHQLNAKHSISLNTFYADNSYDETWQTCPPAIFLSQELGNLFDHDPIYTDAFVTALASGSNLPTPPSSEAALLAQQVVLRASQLGLSVACGQANQNFDETKWGFEIEDRIEFNEDFRMIAGIGLRNDKIRGDSLFDGEPRNSTWYLFSNFEWQLADKWLLNGGLLYENDDYVDSVVSPRVALNYQANEHSAWRLIAAKGSRTPDFYEQVGHRHYQVVNLTPPVNGQDNFATFYLTPQSGGNLYEETINSYELGYFYNKQNLSLDVKLFHEEVKDAIDGLFALEAFAPLNNVGFTNQGVDLQVKYQINDNNKVWFNYSNLDHDRTAGRSVEHQVATETIATMFQHSFSNRQQFSFAYYNQSMGDGDDFERIDMRYGINFNSYKVNAELDLVIQHRLSKDAFFTSKNVIDDQTIAYIRARFNF